MLHDRHYDPVMARLGRGRARIARALLVLLSLAGGIAAAELIVRAFLPQNLGARAPWYESHPIYRFRHYPNMNAVRNWVNPYHLRTNSRGIRADHDEPYESPGTRIVVHGDSLTFGVGVENEDTYVQRVQHVLRRTIPDVDVLNLAVNAHGPDQEYLFFLEEGRKYSPRICVIAVCLQNDLLELGRPTVAFRLEGERLAYIPYAPPWWKRLAEHATYRWLAERSHLLILTRDTLFDPGVTEAPESQAPPLSLALAVYRDFVAAIRKDGTVPVIMLLPSREQIGARLGVSGPDPQPSPVGLREALLRFCETNGVLCIDALEAFARTPVAFERLFLSGDVHFSAAGHQVIAEVLAPQLERVLSASAEDQDSLRHRSNILHARPATSTAPRRRQPARRRSARIHAAGRRLAIAWASANVSRSGPHAGVSSDRSSRG